MDFYEYKNAFKEIEEADTVENKFCQFGTFLILK